MTVISYGVCYILMLPSERGFYFYSRDSSLGCATLACNVLEIILPASPSPDGKCLYGFPYIGFYFYPSGYLVASVFSLNIYRRRDKYTRNKKWLEFFLVFYITTLPFHIITLQSSVHSMPVRHGIRSYL